MKNAFTDKIEKAIKDSFPHSRAVADIGRMLGETHCVISFTLGADNSEYANGIINNDNCHHTIFIYGFDEQGNRKETLEVSSDSGSFYVKPVPGSYLAYSRVKTGWRNFKANEVKTVEKIGNYFAKVKQLLNENFDNLTDDTKALMQKKGYKNG